MDRNHQYAPGILKPGIFLPGFSILTEISSIIVLKIRDTSHVSLGKTNSRTARPTYSHIHNLKASRCRNHRFEMHKILRSTNFEALKWRMCWSGSSCNANAVKRKAWLSAFLKTRFDRKALLSSG